MADLAGLRQETISRLEAGKYTARPGTVDRIMDVIEAERRKRSGSARKPRSKAGTK